MTAEKPKAGGILNSSYCNLFPKSFVYDFIRHLFYFSLYDDAAGVYKIALDDIEKLQNINSINDLKPYLLDADVQINPITEEDKGEGSDGEYIGICQMAFDMVRGDVYFGYRSANPEETGLYRYNAETNKISLIPDTKGVEIYGVAIDNRWTPLFTAVQSPEAGTSLSVYPNPTTNVLWVEGVQEDNSMNLYSLSGNIVLTQTAHTGVNKIDVTSIPNGLYILRVDKEAFKVTKR